MAKNTVFSEGDFDPRARRLLRPVKVVWQTGVADADKVLAGKEICIVRTGASLLVDFGREIHGGIRIRNWITPKHGPARVRIRFGESVAEAMGQVDQDHSIHDMTVDIPWYGYQEYGNTAFRYVRIDVVGEETELHIRDLQAVFLYRDLEYKGSFECSNERLNRIWDTGAYTVHLCMQDMLWDGSKRDRLVWIGDIYPETMTVSSVFGDCEVVPKSLDFVREETPLPNWMNGISSYSLWWIIVHRAWYRYHGNRAYLEQQRPYLCGLLNQLMSLIGPNGEEQLTGARFLDWPSSEDKRAIHAGLQALLRMTFQYGAELCGVLGEDALRIRCLEGADRLKQHQPEATPSKQANALLALSGLADPAKVNREILAKDPVKNISTFYGYYVLQARALAGDYAGALDVIERYWGAMLDLGATTFWEDFDLEWTKDAVPLDQLVPDGKKSIHADYGNYCYKGLRHSLCHGWASGPTAWMTEHVLGFRPLEPGCGVLEIQPHLGALEFARGTFPTPKGVVSVSHTRGGDGNIATQYEAPAGIEVRVISPA